MDDRLTGAAGIVVGAGLAAVGIAEYVAPGFAQPPYDPFATGALVVFAGVSLVAAGALALSAALDPLALRAAAGVGAVTLLLAVLYPASLLFGGVFWLAMVGAGLVGAGAYRTVSHVRTED